MNITFHVQLQSRQSSRCRLTGPIVSHADYHHLANTPSGLDRFPRPKDEMSKLPNDANRLETVRLWHNHCTDFLQELSDRVINVVEGLPSNIA